MKLTDLFRFAAFGTILFSLSCKKRGDFELPCKIKTMTNFYRFNETDPLVISTYTFSYNAWGDPTHIIQSNPQTGMPHYHFTYDNNRRLKTMLTEYGGPIVEYYTRYYYDNNGFIVRDTTWYSGTDTSNVSTFYQTMVTTYQYDSKGRVSKENFHVVGIPASASEKSYSYDANDNLVRSEVYDNHPNFLRTSLVLSFITRNYSKNNYLPALTYNSKGLPTSYPLEAGKAPVFMNNVYQEITYTCDDRNKMD